MRNVNDVLERLRDYWSLTLRQVYYQLVASQVIPNNMAEYKKLSRLLTKARLDNLCSWEALEDRLRSHLESGGWRDKNHFIKTEINGNVLTYS